MLLRVSPRFLRTPLPRVFTRGLASLDEGFDVPPVSFSAVPRCSLQHKVVHQGKRSQPVYLPPTSTGINVLHNPCTNKGTAFTARERDRLGLRGLLPPRIFSIDEQAERIYENLRKGTEHLPEPQKSVSKYLFLNGLQDRNETLFYKLLEQHIAEMAPIIYTPTVGYACQNFHVVFRRPRGMYFTLEDKGEMMAMVQNWPHDEVDVIVVTDGSRILGLGDLGVQGMGIPIGKLSLYVAAGGINPARCMPVVIDVGTNNKELVKSPYYMGLTHPRVEGREYVELIDEFMLAIKARFPKAIVQFEDFKSPHAELLLKRYRDTFRCFNDDIQGTGAVTLAGLLAAHRKTGNSLTQSKIVCVGAGGSGVGVCESIVDGMMRMGLSKEDAQRRFWMRDSKGVITTARSQYKFGQQQFARADDIAHTGETLLETVRRVKPTVLLGLSTMGGVFTEAVVREMATHVKEPIIFAMSNPTNLSECTAEQAYKWTDGRAVFASGSPFDPVSLTHPDGTVTQHVSSQANNMFIFPGVGLGVHCTLATSVTNRFFFEAARALANFVDEKSLQAGKIRDVSHTVAMAVGKAAAEEGLATITPNDGDWNAFIADSMWKPEYATIIQSRAT